MRRSAAPPWRRVVVRNPLPTILGPWCAGPPGRRAPQAGTEAVPRGIRERAKSPHEHRRGAPRVYAQAGGRPTRCPRVVHIGARPSTDRPDAARRAPEGAAWVAWEGRERGCGPPSRVCWPSGSSSSPTVPAAGRGRRRPSRGRARRARRGPRARRRGGRSRSGCSLCLAAAPGADRAHPVRRVGEPVRPRAPWGRPRRHGGPARARRAGRHRGVRGHRGRARGRVRPAPGPVAHHLRAGGCRGSRRARRSGGATCSPCWHRGTPAARHRRACTGGCGATATTTSTRWSSCDHRGSGCCRCPSPGPSGEDGQPAASSSSRPRSRTTSREWSWQTRDSVTPSSLPISARVRFSS